jgi:hypothetical protein
VPPAIAEAGDETKTRRKEIDMAKAVIIQASGEVMTKTVIDLVAMQRIVGGFIEVVPLGDCDLYVNEDGISMQLPPNKVATKLARRRLDRSGKALPTRGEWILGDVFILGPDDGDASDCPADVLTEALEMRRNGPKVS